MKLKELFLPFLLLALLLAGTALLPVISLIDATHPWQFSEYSITEITQEVLLLLIGVTFFVLAKRDRSAEAPALTLFASFVGGMFIRELDFFLDMIVHGFWKIPVALLVFGTVGFVLRKHSLTEIFASIVLLLRGHAFLGIAFALNTVLCISRLLGRNHLWRGLFQSINANVNRAVDPLLVAAGQGIDLSSVADAGTWLADSTDSWANNAAGQAVGITSETTGAVFPAIELDYRLIKSFVEESLELYGYFLLFIATLFYIYEWHRARKPTHVA